MSSSEAWDIELTAGDGAATDTCLYLPSNALPGVDLPKRLLVRGPDDAAVLVGSKRIGGAGDEWVIRVSPALLTKLAPGLEYDLRVPARLECASWGDVCRYMPGEDRTKILTAVVVAIAAIAAAVVAFATRKVGVGYAAAVLTLVALAAVLKARTEIRDAIRPKCG